VALSACQREERPLHQPPNSANTIATLQLTPLQPGRSDPPPTQNNPDENIAYAMAQGKQLFNWYNCNGCHANGGGDKGPALMDDIWIYGAEPGNIFASIVQGRPNGMPSFRGRIPDYQVWQLVAFIRSMNGLVPKDAAPSRNDSMQAKPSEQQMERQTPTQAATPPASLESH